MLGLLAVVLVLHSVDSLIVDSSVYVVDAKGQVLHPFSSRSALFGPDLPDKGISGHLVYASPRDACSKVEPPPNNKTNWVVLIRRNECNFSLKVLNAQRAGFVAAIVHNIDSDQLVQMSGETADSVTIPSVFIGNTGANTLLKYNYSLSHIVHIEPINVNYTKFLWPFIVVLAVCMSVLLLCTVVKCVVNQIRKCLSRLSPSSLRKLPIKKFHKGDRFDMCAICLEEYEDGDRLRLLPCSHTFHKKCIDPWLTKNKRTCPLCKKKAIPRSGSDNYSDSDDSADDSHVVVQSSERTPLLMTAAHQSNSYGMMMPDLGNGAARNDLEAASRSDAMTSSPWQLSSSVEVHRVSGSDSDNEPVERPVISTPAAQCDGITSRRNTVSEIDLVESVSVMEPTVNGVLACDRSGATIV